MRIFRCLEDIQAPFPGAVVTIGNFDGIHLGHREIFRRVVRQAREIDGTAVVLTFVPHPLKVLAPAKAPPLINSYAEKERLIEASCIDVLICVPFDRQFAELPAPRFVDEILVRRIGTRSLVVGYDYAFGRNREGNVDFLKQAGEKAGFDVEVLGPILQNGGMVYSSSRIRDLLRQGEVARVVDLLGRHFSLQGRVVPGACRGRKLGFPTANLASDKEGLLGAGVYAVKVRVGDAEELRDGVANIGCNPTFGGAAPSLEVHLLDFSGTLYGQSLRVYFLDRLRDELTFSSADALAAAIGADIRRARTLLAAARVVEYHEYLDCGTEAGHQPLPGEPPP